MIGLVLFLMVFATCAPMSITVWAGTTDTITLTFDPMGNISIEVAPESYDFGTIWASSGKPTASNYFTIWNNGTINNMDTDILITDDPDDLAVNETAPPGGVDYYSLLVLQGSVSAAPWVKESDWSDLDSDIDMGGTDNFGLCLYISNISQNWTQQTMVVTLMGTPPS